MNTRLGHFVRNFACLWAIVMAAACSAPQPSDAAPFAAIVQDARTGEVLYSENADTRLHPASLTKMLTLYIAFEEIERGNLSLDSIITVSKNAAAQPPSRLGLKAGQKIALRYLIRAAAIKSANDAASAIGDAIGGNEARFAARMTRTAKALGMKNSTFKNANGLTAKGHLSTARDMNLLGRRIFYDFPQYYNIFSRRTTDAGMAQVRNTNARFLDAYKGADGIKTGYTNAAGFNLTASAERGGVRIVATVFGGTSTAQRNAKMAELMDIGFRRAPKNAPIKAPPAPAYDAPEVNAMVAQADRLPEVANGAAKTIRLQTAVARSPRPQARPGLAEAQPKVAVTEDVLNAIEADVAAALAEAVAAPPPPETLDAQAVALAEAVAAALPEAEPRMAALALAPPPSRPEQVPSAATPQAAAEPTAPDLAPVELAATAADSGTVPQTPVVNDMPEPQAQMAQAEIPLPTADVDVSQPLLAMPSAEPDSEPGSQEPIQVAAVTARPVAPRNAPIFDRFETAGPLPPESAPVVIRLSTSNARHFGINLGKFSSRSEAERVLLKTQLTESATLSNGLRKVVSRGGGYEANFLGLSQDQADLACRRLQARGIQCFTMAP